MKREGVVVPLVAHIYVFDIELENCVELLVPGLSVMIVNNCIVLHDNYLWG